MLSRRTLRKLWDWACDAGMLLFIAVAGAVGLVLLIGGGITLVTVALAASVCALPFFLLYKLLDSVLPGRDSRSSPFGNLVERGPEQIKIEKSFEDQLNNTFRIHWPSAMNLTEGQKDYTVVITPYRPKQGQKQLVYHVPKGTAQHVAWTCQRWEEVRFVPDKFDPVDEQQSNAT